MHRSRQGVEDILRRSSTSKQPGTTLVHDCTQRETQPTYHTSYERQLGTSGEINNISSRIDLLRDLIKVKALSLLLIQLMVCSTQQC